MRDVDLTENTMIELVLKKDRVVVLTALLSVVVLAWLYTISGVGMQMSPIEMTVMSGRLSEIVMQPMAWSPTYASLVFLMWWIMMIAMMIPAAAPMLLLYTAIIRKRPDADSVLMSTGTFLLGYLSVWAVFSLVATALQWTLEQASMMNAAMSASSGKLAGIVFIAAGLYQFTELKRSCLKHCRHPLVHLSHNWRKGLTGAFRMGTEHGAFCLGCCWFLMALLFVGGIMNVIWIAALAVYVILEKFTRHGGVLSIVVGCGLTCWGIFVLVTALSP